MLRCLASLPLLAILATSAHAEEHLAQVRGSSVVVDRQVRWRGRAVTSELVWSDRGDAVAFTGRDRAGKARLVVLIVDDALEPAVISWPVPPSARPARAVTWLGDGRVGAGPSTLAPKMVAEYTLGVD